MVHLPDRLFSAHQGEVGAAMECARLKDTFDKLAQNGVCGENGSASIIRGFFKIWMWMVASSTTLVLYVNLTLAQPAPSPDFNPDPNA